MPTGQRGSAPVSPMDRTGQLFRQQQREQAAKKARAAEVEEIDIDAIKRAEFGRGYEHGYTKGADNGFDAAVELLERAGFITYDADTDSVHRLTDAEFDALPADEVE